MKRSTKKPSPGSIPIRHALPRTIDMESRDLYMRFHGANPLHSIFGGVASKVAEVADPCTQGFCRIWAGTIVVNGYLSTNEWYRCIGIHLSEFPMCSLHPICDLCTQYSLFSIDPYIILYIKDCPCLCTRVWRLLPLLVYKVWSPAWAQHASTLHQFMVHDTAPLHALRRLPARASHGYAAC